MKQRVALSVVLGTVLGVTWATGCAHTPQEAQPAPAPTRETRDVTAEQSFTTGIEGPSFSPQGDLFAVNAKAQGTVGKVSLETGEVEIFLKLPAGGIGNSIQFNRRGKMLIADYVGHKIWKVDLKTKKIVSWVHDARMNQPNDIAIAQDDTLFLSDPNWNNSSGQLWRVSPKGKATLVEKNLGTTNGIALCFKDRLLYVGESAQLKVWRYEVGKNKELRHKTLFAEFKDGDLDGMKCDDRGNLYVARHGLGLVLQFSPEGKVLREIRLAGKNGSNLVLYEKKAYVTVQDRGAIEVFELRD